MKLKAEIIIILFLGAVLPVSGKAPDINEFWKDFKTNLLTGNFDELKDMSAETILYGSGGDGCYIYEKKTIQSDWSEITEVFRGLLEDISNKSVYKTEESLPKKSSVDEFFFAYCLDDYSDKETQKESRRELKKLKKVIKSKHIVQVMFYFEIIGFDEDVDGGPGGFAISLFFGVKGNKYKFIGMTRGA